MPEKGGSWLSALRPALPGPWAYVLNRSLAQLFPLEASYAVFQPFADALHELLKDKRETARQNYARVLGRSADDPHVERMAHECFRQFARYLAEMMHLQAWDTETLLERLSIEGEEHFQEAESLGKGIIFTSAHMGSTEIAASLVALRGQRVTAVSELIRPKFLMDWAEATRARMGITLLPAGGSGIKLLRALRRKEMVALVVDVGIDRGQGAPITFFGHKTVFPSGPARLARLSGAPIVFGLAARKPGGRFLAHIEPPILADRSLPEEEDIRLLTQRIADTIERYVRRYPEQWYPFRQMWPGDSG